MGLFLFVTICLVGSTLAYHSGGIDGGGGGWGGGHSNGGWGGGMVVSRRDAGEVSVEDIYQMVRDTLDQASAGINADDLGIAATNIQIAADAYLDANGGTVPAEDVEAVIDEVANTFNGAVAVSALFDDALTYQASLLDAAFCLWKGLVEKAEALQAAGETPLAPIAAISMTAESIQTIVLTTETVVYYNQHVDEQAAREAQSNRRKRWEVSGSVSHSSSSGTSASVGVSHSWRRATRAADKEQEKRAWGGGGDGLGGGHGGGLGGGHGGGLGGGHGGGLGGGHGGGWKRAVRSADAAVRSEEESTEKRLIDDGPNVGGGTGGGWPGSGWPGSGRPHGWRRASALRKRGDWTGSVTGGYSTGGGASVGVSIGYKW